MVLLSVKLDDLRFPASVVDMTRSDLDSLALPPGNLVHNLPTSSDVGPLEATVDDDVLGGSGLDESHVVDGEASSVILADSFEPESVLASNGADLDVLPVDLVVAGED